jgi:hypothetical protein
MLNRILLVPVLILLLLGGSCAKEMNYSMSSNITPKLVGSWKLISFHSKDSSGQTAYPFGKDAQGRLIYEPNGRMAVQLMNPTGPGRLQRPAAHV